MTKCKCDGNTVFGGDNHSIECKNKEDETEIGYDPDPNAEANKLWEAR